MASSVRLRAALSSGVSSFSFSTASGFPPRPTPSARGDAPSVAPSTPLIAFFFPFRPPSLPFLDGPCWLLPASGSGDGDPRAASAFALFFFLARASRSSGSGEGDGDGDGDGVGDAGGDGDGVGDADCLASPVPAFFLGADLGTDLDGGGVEASTEGVGDGDPFASPPVLAFLLAADLDGGGGEEASTEGVGDGDPCASPPVLAFLLAADFDGRGEGSGEGVGEAVGASSSVAFFFFCLALSWAVRAADEVAVRRVASSGSLTSDAVVSSSISVSRFITGWLF